MACTDQVELYTRKDEERIHNESCEPWESNPPGIFMDLFGNRYPSLPKLTSVCNGMATELDELKAIGNGQVPVLVVLAWKTLSRLRDLA